MTRKHWIWMLVCMTNVTPKWPIGAWARACRFFSRHQTEFEKVWAIGDWYQCSLMFGEADWACIAAFTETTRVIPNLIIKVTSLRCLRNFLGSFWSIALTGCCNFSWIFILCVRIWRATWCTVFFEITCSLHRKHKQWPCFGPALMTDVPVSLTKRYFLAVGM